MNTDELEQAVYMAGRRVLEIQAKLHRWAVDDPHRRFGDLFNLVADPAFLLVAWDLVPGNKGAKTAGVDGHTAVSIQARGVEEFSGRCGTVRETGASSAAVEGAPDSERARPNTAAWGSARSGLGSPGVLEAGAGADLRGGFPPVLLRVPPQTPGS